jgi:hypothetical protein
MWYRETGRLFFLFHSVFGSFFFLRWCDDEAGVDLRRCGLYPSPSTFYLYVSLLCT